MTLAEDSEMTDATTVVVTYTEETARSVEKYEFSLEPSDTDTTTPVEKTADDVDRTVTFPNLTPGTVYTVTVKTLAGGIPSAPETIQIATGRFSGMLNTLSHILFIM